MVGKKKNITIIVIVIVSIVIIGGVLTWGFLTNWGRKKVDEKQEQLDKAKEQLLKLHKELYVAKERVKITTKKVDLDTKVLEIKTKKLTEQIKKDNIMKEDDKTSINNNLKKLAAIQKQENDLQGKSKLDESSIKTKEDIIKNLKSSINKLNEKNKEELEKIRKQSIKLQGTIASLDKANQELHVAKEQITKENKEIEEVHKAEDKELSFAIAKINFFRDKKAKLMKKFQALSLSKQIHDKTKPWIQDDLNSIEIDLQVEDEEYSQYVESLKQLSPDTYKKICVKFNWKGVYGDSCK